MGVHLRIGILCLQGDYQAHGRMLERLGQDWSEVRRPSELEGLQGIILPGGESTTMWHFLAATGLDAALKSFARSGAAMYGTCAGTILLAREVLNPPRSGLGILDLTVERNSYGRQTESSVRSASTDDDDNPRMEAALIRAPRIVRIGDAVRVRAHLDGDPVWVEQGNVISTTFHPELGEDTRIHERFLELAQACTPFKLPCTQLAS